MAPWRGVAACLVYMGLSPAAMFMNKYMLTGRDPHTSLLSLPLTVTFIQQMFCYLIMLMQRLYVGEVSTDGPRKSLIEKIRQQLEYGILGPTLFGIQILCSNVCLKYVDVASYQIARSSSAVIAVIHQSIQRRRIPSVGIAVSCIIISAGLFLTAFDKWYLTSGSFQSFDCKEIFQQFSGQECLMGLSLGLIASIAGVLGMAEQKKTQLKFKKAYPNNPAHAQSKILVFQQRHLLILYPLIIVLFTEEPKRLYRIISNCHDCWGPETVESYNEFCTSLTGLFTTVKTFDGKFIPNLSKAWTSTTRLCTQQILHPQMTITEDLRLIALSSLIVVLMPYCTSLSLAVLSPLTLTIAGYAKSCIQYVLGAFIFHEPMSPLTKAGVICCLSGCGLFSYLRGWSDEAPAKKIQSDTPNKENEPKKTR